MLLSFAQAAQLLQCNVESVRRWVRAGKLKTYETPGGVRVCLSDLGLPPEEVKQLNALALEVIRAQITAAPPASEASA